MSYSYSEPLSYGYQQPLGYGEVQQKKPSSMPYAIGGLAVGAAAGGYAGSKVNPFVSKNGEAVDSFARSVLDKSKEAAPEAEKKIYNQNAEILKKLDSVKTKDELTTLFNNNKEAVDEIFGNSEDFLKNVTDENIAQNKKTIKQKFTTAQDTSLQDIKNKIQACWDKDKKNFKKADSVEQETFNAIEKSTKGVKAKAIAKYAAVAGLATGAVAFVAHKLLSMKKDTTNQAQ